MLQYSDSPGLIEGKKEDKVLARLRYEALDDKHWNVSSTWVDPSLRGQGVASTLMEKVAAKAAEADVRLVGTCSYAEAWLKRKGQN